MSLDFLMEIASILDTFFRGLTECHVLTRYTVQLKISELDQQIMVKIKSLIQALIQKLQRVFFNIPVIHAVLPVNNSHLDSKEQNDIASSEPVKLTTVPNQLVDGMPPNCTGIIDYFKIKNDVEKDNYKRSVLENKIDLYKVSKFHSRASNLDCIINPHHREMKKEENLTTAYPLSDLLMKNIASGMYKDKEDESEVAEEKNSLHKPPVLNNLSTSKLVTNYAAENIVHIIVETIDRKSNLNASDSRYRIKNDEENNCIESNDVTTSKISMKDYLRLDRPSNHIDKQGLKEREGRQNSQSLEDGFGSFTCSCCSKSYQTFQDLKKHNAGSHSSNEKQYKCVICNKTFITKLGLTRHVDSHGEKKTAVCDICGKSFRRSDYLQIHSKIHLGKKKFICSTCPKEFILKTQLKHHEKIHSDIKDFVCDICNKGFNRKDKLKEHILRHLNIKKFQCSMCNKCYAENRDLRRHLKSHMKTKQC